MCTDAHMKTHIALALLALVLLFLVDPNCLVAAACGNFELDRLSPDSIDTQFSGAIIKLTTSDGSGTGYLVDAEHGYILTAAHVIPKVSAPLIKGSTKSLPKQILSLRLKAIERDPKADLAVLQIDGDNVLKTLRPLDISLRAPRRGKFYAMAYPVDSDTVSAGTYKAREVDLSEVNYQSGTIRVDQAAYSADSGGPLIDLTGTVVATNHGKIGPDNPEAGAPRSSYILLANGIDLIEKSIEPTARVKQLDDRVRRGAITRDDLRDLLEPSPSALSNLELISWAVLIADPASQYKDSGLFSCPIIEAIAQRRLDDLLTLLAPRAAADARARAYLTAAQLAGGDGRITDAAAEFKVAMTSFRGAINQQVAREPTGLVRAKCQLGANDKRPSSLTWLRVNSKSASSKVPCATVESDPYLASLLQDYSLTTQSLATIDPKRKQQLLEESKTAAGLAILVQDNQASRALSYTYLGDALGQLDDNAHAAAAYSSAYHLGLTSDWVATNGAHYYLRKVGRDVGGVGSADGALKRRIVATVPTLDAQALSTIIGGLPQNTWKFDKPPS